MGRHKKVIANPFLMELSVNELREFLNETLEGYHVFVIQRLGSSRKALCWEEDNKNKGVFEISIYDNRIVSKNSEIFEKNPEIIKKWKNFMYEKFGEAYKEKYMKE